MGLREDILALDDLKPHVVPVEVPEWGKTLHVRVMTGKERDNFEGAFAGVKHRNLRAFLVVTCACDEEGVSVFQPNDVEALGDKSAAALDRLFEAASKANGLLPSDKEAVQKKSEPSPSTGSPSASRHL